jgi:glycosyltransferase A (GT-A) superfamily protein (DUF2064 family)
VAEPAIGAPSIVAIVPTLNEASAIGEVVTGLKRAGAYGVIVVDSGSADDTREAAAAAGAHVVHEPVRGYGRACRTGVEAALRMGGCEYLAFLDGDGSCDPADLAALAAAAGKADLVLGVRPPSRVEAGALPWHARLGNRMVALAIWARTGRHPLDLSPYKLVRADTLSALHLDADGYAWTAQMIVRALADPELKVSLVPVRFRQRRGGTSKVSGQLGPSLRAGVQMLRAVVTPMPPRPLLVLMAKAPGGGAAKTRLAAELGEGLAAGFWEACLEDVGAGLRSAAAANGLARALMVPAADLEAVQELVGPGWTGFVQKSPGLAPALVGAFVAAARRGSPFAIAVSGDNPSLPPSLIRAAVRALERDDSVLGPCPDGGYYLVGLRLRGPRLAQRLESAFQSVESTTGAVIDQTEAALKSAGWRPVRVGSWPDVDTIADLRALTVDLARDPRPAPATAAWIRLHPELLDRASA